MNFSPAFKAACVTIEWPFNAPQPALRCPSTGNVIAPGFEGAAERDPITEIDYSGIPTVLFVFLGEINEFLYIRPDIQESLKKRRVTLETSEEDSEDDSDFEILTSSDEMFGDVPLIFELNTGGMACGPVWSTVWIGLDIFAPFSDDNLSDGND